jgi:predicted amidophosphoribosyltransferase
MKATDAEGVMEVIETKERELCISCLEENEPGAHFCRHCNTPLTSYAATAPFESLFAEGDFWRKAASRGRHAGLVRFLIILILILLVASFVVGWLVPR